jgi:anti-anti-sigma factor
VRADPVTTACGCQASRSAVTGYLAAVTRCPRLAGLLVSGREGGTVPATEYLFQMIGGVPVVTAPAEIDTTTAGELRTILLEWHNRGHATVVVDLTGTQFCDSAGLRELMTAHKRAVADGGGLRLLTVADGAFMRIFTIIGLDGIIPHFPTLKQALTGLPAPAHIQEEGGLIADSRRCEQCGAVFVPVREHARFCTSDCRAAWNRGHMGDPAVEASALIWSIAAMSDAVARLPTVKVWDQPQAFAAIEDAVWWITMIDSTLVRHHPRAYDAAMAAHTPAERRRIYETLAGLRFVRNWISRAFGLGELIETGTGTGPITRWTWKPLPEPALAWLPPRAQAWEQARYRAYKARLAGRYIDKPFGQALTFLTLTGGGATSLADTSQHATRSYREGVDQPDVADSRFLPKQLPSP